MKHLPKLYFFCLFLIFWALAGRGLDPDFGWHFRMGEYILNHGIPATDPFSYTMPSFPFIDHEWLTNVCISLLLPRVGYAGLAGFFALLATCAIAVQTYKKTFLVTVIPVTLVAFRLVEFLGVRPQVITWLLFSILLLLTTNNALWQRFRFTIPFLVILWTNLHGGFAISIAVLFVFCLSRIVERPRGFKTDLIICLLSLSATLINPYGYRVWEEVVMQMTDTNLRWSVSEWLPLLYSSISLPLLLLMTVSGMTLVLLWKKISLFEKLVYVGLLFAGFSSLRHIQLWLFIALPIAMQGITLLVAEAGNRPGGTRRLRIVFVPTVVITLILFLFTIGSTLSDDTSTLKESQYYPAQAVTYLRHNLPAGNILSAYNWGGYLIWKLPGKKVFVDGRMPSWRWTNAPSSESNYAFQDFQAISAGTLPLEEVAEKYKIDTLLLPSPRQTTTQPLHVTVTELVTKLTPQKKSTAVPLRTQIQNNGWKIVYQDNTAIIYQKMP